MKIPTIFVPEKDLDGKLKDFIQEHTQKDMGIEAIFNGYKSLIGGRSRILSIKKGPPPREGALACSPEPVPTRT